MLSVISEDSIPRHDVDRRRNQTNIQDTGSKVGILHDYPLWLMCIPKRRHYGVPHYDLGFQGKD